MLSERFSCSMYADEIERLRIDLYEALADMKESAGAAGLLLPLGDGRVRATDQRPLTIALIGQYNAGKSTILKALTGRSDIKIDSDVCTERIEIYEWHGIQLIDTPGIHAGRSDHDSITYDAIDRADLLIFVITNELFDNLIGSHFRRLAFEKQKARELMLVVNKMSQDPGTAAQKKQDIRLAVDPLSLDEIYTTFTDAESFLDAQDSSDPDDRRELTELSGIEALVSNMNRLVADRGLGARLTTPVFEIRRIANQMGNYFSVDQIEERMGLELLYRKRDLLIRSRGRIETQLRSELARSAVTVNTLGDRFAESIKPGISETELEQRTEAMRQQAEEAYRKTAQCVESLVASEIEYLRQGIEAMGSSPLSQQLRQLIKRRMAEANNEEQRADPGRDSGLKQGLADTADRLTSLKRIGSTLDQIGSMVKNWTTGPSAGAGAMSATAVAGSSAHTFVYNVGKFFGVKFAPWGAVHTTQIIGKTGVTIGAFGSILGVFAQVSEDIRNDEVARELRAARDSVRRAVRDYVSSVEEQFWVRFKSLNSELYEEELAAVAALEKTIVGQRLVRSDTSALFQQLAMRATDLIRRMQTDGEFMQSTVNIR